MKGSLAVLALLALSPLASAQRASVGDFTLFNWKGNVFSNEGVFNIDPLIAFTDGLNNAASSMILSCQDNQLAVAFDPVTYLGPGTYEMSWKFDDQEATSFTFALSFGGTWAYVPPSMVTAFLGQAGSFQQVKFQVNNSRGQAFTDTFKLGSITEAAKQLKCK
ncbi:hypothetical protein [Deinococcus yavapaiensis]|uniref:Uncharacterized protein n=1 Tax=Deinococcus yavapaiensis KR-236 TaxID=694435 RepID=A0A318SAR3_9DEIO|nr:hypothetical protein [Deinococcus yavapaiensis]PYE55652.1 hypothetical protein DES52_10215 [Deinococcus yavapaiensis KR-236]